MSNLKYKFKWRKKWLWRSKKVSGHRFEEKQNKMVLYLENGGVQEIANWDQCECYLGTDWVNATKSSIKEEVGE